MAVKCGVDLIEVERIEQALARDGEAFRARIYTPDEVRYCELRGAGKFQSYAARFAAKEAVAKALGTGFRGEIAWTEIEVVVDDQGRPDLRFHGQTRALVQAGGIGGISLSLSHTDRNAVAVVVLEF
jgi:holo-[acyl-carrier protein] synthase